MISLVLLQGEKLESARKKPSPTGDDSAEIQLGSAGHRCDSQEYSGLAGDRKIIWYTTVHAAIGRVSHK
jgi:hypothetical protein